MSEFLTRAELNLRISELRGALRRHEVVSVNMTLRLSELERRLSRSVALAAQGKFAESVMAQSSVSADLVARREVISDILAAGDESARGLNDGESRQRPSVTIPGVLGVQEDA